jgi:Uma2 family endonuclease
MAEPIKDLPRMTAAEFMAWYIAQPAGQRYELLDGTVYPRRNVASMQGERLVHGRIKTRIAVQFANQIREKGLPCDTLADGMAVRVGPETTFEPDALVRCGPDLPDDTVILDDAVVVVEVTSPSSHRLDVGSKLMRYFRNPAIRHYLIVVTEPQRGVVHHHRSQSGAIVTTTHESGVVVLDPPGLSLDVDELLKVP